MQKNIMKAIDLDFLKRMLVSFKAATGIQAAFVDLEGNYIIEPVIEKGDSCFCELIRNSETGAKRCRDTMKRAGENSAKLGETYISRCHAGMVSLTMAVFCEDEHIGSIVCGPMTMWEWDSIAEEETIELLEGIELDFKDVIEEASKLRSYNAKSIKGASDLLFAVSTKINQSGEYTIRYNNELNRQQSKISSVILEKKKTRLTEEKTYHLTQLLPEKLNESL